MTVVLNALVAGAGALATAGGAAAGKDLYDRLVAAVRGRFDAPDDRAEVDEALGMLERRPDSPARRGVVGELLEGVAGADDPELVDLANRLLADLGMTSSQVQAHQVATGRNVIQQVGDGQGAIVDRSRNRG